jgi:hypothetical protein
LGRRRTVNSCGACGTLSSTGERWRTMVDDGAVGGSQRCSEVGHPTSFTSASSCKWALADVEATAVRILGTDIDGEQRSVVAPVSRGDGGGESEQSGESV